MSPMRSVIITFEQPIHHSYTLALGPGADLTTETLAQWLVLRCYPQYFPLPLHLSLVALISTQILDSRGDAISMF